MVWYHDHALGNTRTNVYAGLAGAYIIRDDQDTGEPGNPLGLPAGPYEIPLVLQDKTFNADGSMFYPTEGVTAHHPQWVPEFFGDVAVVNAKIWPFVDVEPRRYRLRIVNGSQSRFYNLQFVNEKSGRALPFTQIGTDGGLLRAPVRMSRLLIAPGERADLIVDFAGRRNASFIVTNNARAPYPMGGRATLSQLLKIRVNRPLQGRTPRPNPRTSSCRRAPRFRPSVTRVNISRRRTRPGLGRRSPSTSRMPLPRCRWPSERHDEAEHGATEDWLLVNTTADAPDPSPVSSPSR